MRIYRFLTVILALILLVGCSSSRMTPTQIQAKKQHIYRVCSEHYAHIMGLNDGRYDRRKNTNYAKANECPNNHSTINKEYAEGFKYGVTHK